MTTPDLSGMVWRKSSRSEDNGGQCIEIAAISQGAFIRDSKNPGGGALNLSLTGWDAFKRAAKDA